MRVLGVLGVIAFDENDARAFLFGFANLCSGFDAEGLGFVAGGDADGSVGEGGDDGEGLPRYSGWSCCSTDAKKLLRSMWRKAKRSGWAAWDI